MNFQWGLSNYDPLKVYELRVWMDGTSENVITLAYLLINLLIGSKPLSIRCLRRAFLMRDRMMVGIIYHDAGRGDLGW